MRRAVVCATPQSYPLGHVDGREPRRVPGRQMGVRIASLTTVVAACLLAGCGGSAAGGASTAPPSDPSRGELPTSGPLPEPARDRPEVELLACARVDGGVRIDAVVTNRSSQPSLLQGVDVTLLDGDEVIEGPNDTSGLWSSVTIGPGRRAFLSAVEDLRDEVADLRCELGPPDLRDGDDRVGGESVDPSLVGLESCADGAALTVTNPTDRPIGVAVIVEFFDVNGFSAGRIEMGQWPTSYTDGRAPGPFEGSLPGGETGTYPITIGQRIEAWQTPVTGPIASCEVVSATYVADPAAAEVIVD